MLDPKDLPPIEAGDDLDRAIRRALAEKRSDFFYLGGVALGALIAISGGILSVATRKPWWLGAGFLVGIAVAFVLAVLGRRQLDYDPSGEIAPAPPEGPPDDTETKTDR